MSLPELHVIRDKLMGKLIGSLLCDHVIAAPRGHIVCRCDKYRVTFQVPSLTRVTLVGRGGSTIVSFKHEQIVSVLAVYLTLLRTAEHT